jgi:hypothetical protein
MNRGHNQAERGASAQRDLFDTQIRIEDQLIEQKSPMWAGNSLAASVARNRRFHQLAKRLASMHNVYFAAQERGREAQQQRIVKAIREEINTVHAAMVAARTGHSVRSLTDTLNGKP